MNCDFETAYSTFILCLILILSGLIIYFLYSKIEYLENNITKHNEVLTDFIENVGKRMMSSCSSCPYLSGSTIINKTNNKNNLETINEVECNKIIVSDDDDNDNDTDSSETDYDSSYVSDEFEQETESDTDYKVDVESNIYTSNNNIKIIEIVKNLDGNEDLLHNILDKTKLEIEEVDNEEGEGEGEGEGEELEEVQDVEEKEDLVKNDTLYNIKKIDLIINEKTEFNDEEKKIVDENVELDMSKLKKMSVNELRSLVVLKGLSNKESSNKMKKNDLLKLFEKQ